MLDCITLYESLISNIINSKQKNLEEEKAQEVAKLQEALQAMQVHVEEVKALVVKEREVAKKAIEDAPPVIKEVPVMVQDTEKVESLTAEVANLKVIGLLSYLFPCALALWFLVFVCYVYIFLYFF